MKGYQKLTIITGVLGLIISFSGLFLYFFINSFIGIPLLGLFFGEALIIAIIIIAINSGAIFVAVKIRNSKIVGGTLIAFGILLFVVVQFFALPSLVLYVIAGILALKEKDIISVQ